MADDKASSSFLLGYYSKLFHQRLAFPVIPYFRMMRVLMRCPLCNGNARILDKFFVCDRCLRGWLLEELLYPVSDNGPATSSGPASGFSRRKSSCLTPPAVVALHTDSSGGVNSYVSRLI